MYICVCKSVTDRQIRQAAREGAESLEDLQRTLGVATGCGCCAECAEELLMECRTRRGGSPPRAAGALENIPVQVLGA